MNETSNSAQSGSVRASSSMRVIQIITGALALVLAGLVLVSPGAAMVVVVFWLSFSLLFGGIEGIITGIWARHLSKGWRAFSLGAGILAVGLSIAAFAFPFAATITTVFLFSMALLILGCGGVARGLLEKRLSGWYRAMLVVSGAIAIGLSMPVMIYPALFGIPTMYTFMSIALVVVGVSYIIAGATGSIFRPRGYVSRSMGKSWESDAA